MESSLTNREIEIAVKLSISAWLLSNRRMNGLLKNINDEDFYHQVSSERNRGIYLLGHLVSVNDSMLTFLGFGDQLFPELDSLFVSNPDQPEKEYPSIEYLKNSWTILNNTLLDHINKMNPKQWLEKHTAVSDQDFEIDPLRNKLSILISRTNHQNHHLGQLTFLL